MRQESELWSQDGLGSYPNLPLTSCAALAKVLTFLCFIQFSNRKTEGGNSTHLLRCKRVNVNTDCAQDSVWHMVSGQQRLDIINIPFLQMQKTNLGEVTLVTH